MQGSSSPLVACALALALLIPGAGGARCAGHHARPVPPRVAVEVRPVGRRRPAPPTGSPRGAELIARLGRQTRAVMLTLEELDAHLAEGSLTAEELDALGRRLASIAERGLRVMQHDVARELER